MRAARGTLDTCTAYSRREIELVAGRYSGSLALGNGWVWTRPTDQHGHRNTESVTAPHLRTIGHLRSRVCFPRRTKRLPSGGRKPPDASLVGVASTRPKGMRLVAGTGTPALSNDDPGSNRKAAHVSNEARLPRRRASACAFTKCKKATGCRTTGVTGQPSCVWVSVHGRLKESNLRPSPIGAALPLS